MLHLSLKINLPILYNKRLNKFFLSGIVLLAGMSQSCKLTTGSAIESEQRPNIIFLLSDDQRWDCFSYSNPYIKTPNCDQLAKEGVIFTNSHHAVPACQPNRASIQLGRYMGSHMCSFSKPTDYTITRKEYDQSYPAILRTSGYYTGFVGKFGFPVSENKIKNVDYPGGQRSTPSQKWLQDEFMPSEYFDVWYGYAGQGKYDTYGEEGHLTKVNGDKAIDFLRKARKQERPFCLSVSFKAPHGPFNYVDPRFEKWYENEEIPRAINDRKEYKDLLPEVVRTRFRGRNGYESEEEYLDFIRAYYGLISGVDDVVGRIRHELEKLGMDENTIIIYTSDNGYFCGSKQLKGKVLLYEESLRAPLIIYNPALKRNQMNRTVDELISVIDIAPTILDLCDINIPAIYQGSSFKSMITGSEIPIRDFVFAENNFNSFVASTENGELGEDEIAALKARGTIRSKVIRTKEYKYLRYHETEPIVEELWNIIDDPLEIKNLVNDPGHSKVLDDLGERCDAMIKANKEHAEKFAN